MPLSLRQAQAELLATNFLDSQADALDNVNEEPVELTATEKAVTSAAAAFVLATRDNLKKADRISGGGLESSIKIGTVVSDDKGVTANVEVLDYYTFVDKGVRGWRDKKGSNSEYAFKAPSGKSGIKTSKMVNAIRKWLIREGLSNRNTKKAITPREGRRAKITDTSTSSAILIAGIIKRDGLKRTGFWSSAVQELEQQLPDLVGEAFKIDIINGI